MSLAPTELRVWPVPVVDPQPATASPILERRGGPTQEVLPWGAPSDHVVGLGPLRAAARPRGAAAVTLAAPAPFPAPPWEEDDGPRATPARDLPDALPLARTIATTTLEALTGARPASQLLRWFAPDVHTQVAARCVAARARRRPGATLPRTMVRGMTSCAPSDHVVEIAAVVVIAPRVAAMALRLEGWDGRWRVTALELR